MAPADRPDGDAGVSADCPTLACEAPPGARPRIQPGNDCWFLAGPTAAGKSALGLRLAERLGAEIVSVDSMAVYRGLDIGTAKPSPDQRGRVPHHVIDVVAPHESYSVARWLADAGAALDAIRRNGRRALFVGGTPLYLRALRDGLDAVPPPDPDLRRRLVEEARVCGSPALHARLAQADPRAAGRIHPNDARRVVRALELAHGGGGPSGWDRPPAAGPFATQMLVLDLPRRLLGERIDRRVDEMFARGLVDEVRRVAEACGGIGPTASQAAGYAECLEHLAGRMSLAEAIRRTKQRTRQLAKRQLTWLRGFKDAVWISA